MFIVWGKRGGSTFLGDLAEQDCTVCEKRTLFQAVLNYTYRHI